MSTARRTGAALVVSFVFLAAGPAGAQLSGGLMADSVSTLSSPAPRWSFAPDFRMLHGDFRDAGAPERNGPIADIPVRDNLHIRLGRFRVIEPARPRTHMEPERGPTDMRRRERGIAAVGVSYRFQE